VTAPDLLDPNFYADIEGMHEALRALRTEGPVWRDERNELWAVLGHDEIIEVERHDEVFCSSKGYRSISAEEVRELDMIALDDPDHAAQRSLVARQFTPKAVRRLEPYLTSLIDELIGAFIDTGEVEVVDQLAAALPARLTAHLIGFDEADAPALRTWSERLMRIDRAMSEPDVGGDFMGAIIEFAQVLGPLIETRRAEPADDLVSVWAGAQLDGCPMGSEVILQETGLFISGGAETTRTVIGRGLAEFARHPDDWEALAADPTLVPDAVEELIRWVTPLNNFFRTATRDARIGDVEVAEGDRVVLLYPSANRDERIFDDPFRFDIRRHPNPHVAFGFGTHFCLGSSLARLELRLLFAALTQRITSLEVLEAPDIEPNIFASAVRSFRLGFTAR
jgi:cytochrome P450 family 142 subfamily A polypeptide 1